MHQQADVLPRYNLLLRQSRGLGARNSIWDGKAEYESAHAAVVNAARMGDSSSVGRWLIEGPKFQRWLQGTGRHTVFYCRGEARAGKTVLA